MPKIYLGLVAVLLLFSGLRGFYSWDFFNLWGMHPKWVWGSGQIFSAGLDLPAHVTYQSLWGSVIGFGLRVLQVSIYPDWLWGTLVVFATLFLCFWVVGKFKGIQSPQKYIVLGLLFLLIKPNEFKQISFGGYPDLFCVVLLVPVILFSFLHRPLPVFFTSLGFLFTKTVLWPWLVIIFVSFALTQKKRLPWAIVFALGINAFTQWLFFSRPEDMTFHNSSLGFTGYSALERLQLVPTIFLANNGLFILACLLVFFFLDKKRFWIFYFAGGFIFLAGVYSFLLGPSPWEFFPSINRYSLPLSLPPFLAFVLQKDSVHSFFEKSKALKRTVFVFGFLALFIRLGEEVNQVKKKGLPLTTWQICPMGSQDPACLGAQQIKTTAKNSASCDSYALRPGWTEKNINQTTETLLGLRLSYLSLPTKVYLSWIYLPGDKVQKICDL